MRLLAAVVVCVALGGTSLHAQTHGAAKATGAGPRGSAPVVKPPAPQVAPPKPEAPKVEPARPEVAKVDATKVEAAKVPQAKTAAAKATPRVPRSLEETGEAIAAALAARAGAPRPPRVNGISVPSTLTAPRYRGPRYLLRWPEIHWDIQWPVASDRVALEWPEPPASN